jgi:hypothetical protein
MSSLEFGRQRFGSLIPASLLPQHDVTLGRVRSNINPIRARLIISSSTFTISTSRAGTAHIADAAAAGGVVTLKIDDTIIGRLV